MLKVTGIVGGSLVGVDPFSVTCWSGSSKYFFSECDRQGLLYNSIGVEVPRLEKYYFILRNFTFNKNVWRQKFHLDTGYYRALTKQIRLELANENVGDICLQIGGIYDVPGIFKGKKKCFSYHDGNFAQLQKSPFFSSNIEKWKQQLAYEYEKKVYDSLDGIFTMSQYLRRSFIEDFNIHPDKVYCIGAGVNMDKIPDELNKQYDKKNLLFVGIDFIRKGGDDLVKAFNLIVHDFPDASLHIVGPSSLPEKYVDVKNIICHGFLSKDNPVHIEKLKKLYSDATLFVLPSRYEPFGIAPLEAMLYQTPCVLTDEWAFPEMVDNGNFGLLIKCGDYHDIATKISSLIGNEERLAWMGNKARDFVLSNFTWEKVVTNMKIKLIEWAG